jgi:hypothetical protein
MTSERDEFGGPCRIRRAMKARSVVVGSLVLALAAGLTACGGSKRSGTGVIRTDLGPVGRASIRAALMSSPNFKIFPRQVASISCRIPRGGPYVPGKMRLDGTCTTRFIPASPPGAGGVVTVVLTERWRYPSGSKRQSHTTWIVPVAHGHVLNAETHTTGASPPQSWF